MCNGLNSLLAIIAQAQSQPPSDCCEKLIAAIGALQTGIDGAIASAAASIPPPAGVDLSAINAALDKLAAAAAAQPTYTLEIVTYLCTCITAAASKIPPPTDVSGIVNAINKQTTYLDVPSALINKLSAGGAFPGDYAQLMSGVPWVSPDTYHKLYKWARDLIDLAAGISDPNFGSDPAVKEVWNDLSDGLLSGMKMIARYLGLPDTSFEAFLNGAFKKFLEADDAIIRPVIGPLVDAIAVQLKPAAGVSPTLGNIGVIADKPISQAVGITLSAGVVAWFASMIKEGTGETLAHLAELVGGAIGFEELRDVIIEPLIRHGLAAVADMNARSLFRQHLPQGSDVAEWAARGLITPAFTQRLLNLDGFGDEIQPPTLAAAFQGINPRQLLRMLPAGLLQDSDLADELTFAGMRPASQDRFRLFAPYMASERERAQLRSSLENAYIAGLLADGEYTAQLDSAEHNLARDDLALRAAKWKKLVTITKDLENEYSTLFVGGLLDDATLRGNLAAIGLQSDILDAVAAKAEARAESALNRQAIRAAAALARATANEERRLAVKGITTGTVPTAAGAAALVATGLTPIQAAAWTGLAELAKIGTVRYVYGLALPPADAALLRSRVLALVTQHEAGLITAEQLTAGLTALKITQPWINAIRAGAVRKVTAPTGATAIAITPGGT